MDSPFPGRLLHQILNETEACYLCPPIDYILPNPSPPPPPSRSAPHLSPFVVIVIAMLSAAFLVVSYYAIVVKYCSNRRAVRSPPTQNDRVLDEDIDEAQAPVNYIWYVNTVGLDESVINSLAICKYRRGEGLVEGTECSVCLNEFRDDESLRLLPKCSHAFHVPCIDTWLKSHVNCPLCRANVISKPGTSSTTTTVAAAAAENSSSEDRYNGGLEQQVGVLLRREDGDGVSGSASDPRMGHGSRVESDLENCIQPVRRSFSMDFSAADVMFVCDLPLGDSRGKGVNAAESSGGSEVGQSRRDGRNPGLPKVGHNASKRASVPMKRSFSSGPKFLLSRSSRRWNSVLPL